jgi:membrane fusion protein, multidrug efflux system
MFRRLISSAFCVLLLSACNKQADTGVDKGQSTADSKVGATEPLVKTCKVTSLVLDRELLLPGEILPYQDVPLYPKIPGFIKWIGVDRGYYVKKGQLLVKMIAPEVKANQDEASAKQQQAKANADTATRKVQTARAQLARAQAKYKANNDTYLRMKKAAEVPGVISGNELEDWRQKAEAELAQVEACQDLVSAAESDLAAVSDLLNYLNITAPYDGMITERNMHEGSFAYPPHGQDGYPPMLRIKQLSLLRVVIPVPDYAVDGVNIGTPIKFTVSAYPNRVFEGKVARIAHSLDPKTRTEPVELNYWNTDRVIDPGMFPQIHWPMKRSYKTTFVPLTAVYTSLETPMVVKIQDGKARWVEVRRGQVMKDQVEVFGDLSEGDTIALNGSDDIADGSPVRTE